MEAPPPNIPTCSGSGGTPTLASLRRLLALVLKTDAEFDAFCLDYFPTVKAQLTDGMTRTRKDNTLLERTDSATVLARLYASYPAEVAAHAAELSYIADPTPEYRDDQARSAGERLRQLYEQKEEWILSGEDASAVDQEILHLRRLLREGPQLQAGEYLQEGRLRLVQRIGKGGFATVWLAYDRSAQQRVAVKVLHGQWADDAQRLERFCRGARRMAQLYHPGIVRVLSEPQAERGFHYFVMKYVAGGDLRLAVQEHHLPSQKSLELIRQIGEALHYAHEHGVIHRDVKPANILLGPQYPSLTDFDLAWAADTTGGTHTGALGTFLYAAPEMMQDAKEVTPAADVYSLAMTAVFALYGAEPIEIVGDRVDFLRALVKSRPLLNVLRKATERNPKDRFQSVAEFVAALAAPATFTANRKGMQSKPEVPSRGVEDLVGSQLNGFRIVRLLGAGGMGMVYEGVHVAIGKRAAVKILNHALRAEAEFAERFLNEARAVNQVKHPGLVDIFDFGELPDGSPFILMEYLGGESIWQRLKRGTVPLHKAVSIARLVAEPLAAVHQKGIIHRDLKPTNVMLVPDVQMPDGERVKILDFGIAVLADSGHLEKESSIYGTPTYISPEQCRANNNLDGKVDVYALGVMLTELITGQPPFVGDEPMHLIGQHLSAAPPVLPSYVPRKLAAFIGRMLAKQPAERPTMEEVAHSLRPFERDAMSA